MSTRSKLVRMEIYNFGCFGTEGASIELDNILCLVGENNSGKSTILKAYEYAVENKTIKPEDKCNNSGEDDLPQVILYVHIPKDTLNIAEKWKITEGEYLLVKSRWQWDNDGKISRSTWNPEEDDYSEDGKAAGLDTVFSSRLPKPFRIGTLDDPEEEHKKLLTIVLQPIADKLKKVIENESSDLNVTIKKVSELASEPVNEEKESLTKLKEDLNKSHNELFPHLNVDLNIDIGQIKIEPLKLLKDNSFIKFEEWKKELQWSQQGTGSQRALFWAMMQVRSELNELHNIKFQLEKDIKEKKKAVIRLSKEKEKAVRDATKEAKDKAINELESEIAKLEAANAEELKDKDKAELSLPSYMLIIDEPEVALHPNAVRTASNYLYKLALDPSWQVMLSTHSPVFINPIADHTTIVRLSRDNNNPTPKIYRTDEPKFSPEERENLKLLNRFDTNLAEIFFGGYPIIVEGDTEYAAFEYHLLNNASEFREKPLITRAHGKATIRLLIKILRHFKIPFSVLHDIDYPLRRDGKKNSAWSTNDAIYKEIKLARNDGIKVIHRISVPYFEVAHIPVETDGDGNIIDSNRKDKPWNLVNLMTNVTTISKSVLECLKDLSNKKASENPFGEEFEKFIQESLKEWAQKNKIKDQRLSIN